MADFESHHHHHRPHRLSVPPRTTTRFPYQSTISTPTPTPSKHTKHRLSSSTSFNSNSNPKSKSKPSSSSSSSSLSFLFLLLFSLRSLYSLFPFLRSSPPSFSLFPFSFLVSLLSFLLTLSFSLFSSSPSSKDPFQQHKPKQQQSLFMFSSTTLSQQRVLVTKSILLSLVFLLRFQALRYCGTAAMIIAEFMGAVTARRIRGKSNRNGYGYGWPVVRGFASLFLGLFMLSFGWDRVECFPFSKRIESGESCVRLWQLLLPFVSGFLACCEQRLSMDWGCSFKQLGHKRVRLITLFFTTIVLFVPALGSFFVFENEEGGGGGGVLFRDLAWPLANTVVFGVLLSENYRGGGDDLVSFKDSRREFLVTFACTLMLELFYFPNISLWGLLICGLLLYVAVRDLDPFDDSLALGEESSSQLLSDMVMKPVRHILSERKSRKIALFLLINTGYMFVEFAAGFMSNSLGLISDACHMLFDCAALAIGLYASYISRLPANNQYNYGRGRFEVLSGYTNAVFLVLVGALIVVESFERILDPQEISTSSLLVVSVGGLLVNVIGLIFFHEEHHHAHGLSGSCSHSHQHSESHSHHPHHDYERHGSDQEFISVSSDCQDSSCSGNPGHHNHSSHERKVECEVDNCGVQSFENHGHAGQHDRHEPAAPCHDHHHHTSHHDNCSHERKDEFLAADNHSIQSFKHDDHAGWQHDHHDHASHHDHHDHHDHSSHRDHHDHHDHQQHWHHHLDANHHNHDTPLVHQEHSHRHIDHNMEGIFLHVLADTLGSVGVVMSTLLIKYKGWLVADPACSIFISILIISSVIPLLRNSAEILLQRVPRVHELELKDSLTNVLKIKGVYGIQKFHLWSFTNTDVVGTLHLHVSTDTDKISIKSQVSRLLHNAGIKDLTLQVECVR